MYNYYDVIALIGKNNNFEIDYLTSLKDIEKLIVKHNHTNDNSLLEFEKAQNGNFESFVYLVRKYGKYTTNTFVFKLKHQLSEIKGCLFNVKENKIEYKICGQPSEKYQSFNYQDFEKLISIIY